MSCDGGCFNRFYYYIRDKIFRKKHNRSNIREQLLRSSGSDL